MSKSVLVIETPKNCKECQLKRDKYKESKLCAATKTYIDSYYDDDSRPDWCPLIPIKEEQCMPDLEKIYPERTRYIQEMEEYLKKLKGETNEE